MNSRSPTSDPVYTRCRFHLRQSLTAAPVNQFIADHIAFAQPPFTPGALEPRRHAVTPQKRAA